MARILRTFAVVAGIVLIVVLGGRLTGVWSDARVPVRASASTEPARPQQPSPRPRAKAVPTKRHGQASAAVIAKRRWVRDASAICRRASRDSAELTASLPDQREVAGLVRLAEAQRRVELRMLRELRRLRPAAGDAFGVSRLVAVGLRRDRIERRVIAAVRSRDFYRAFALAPDLDLAERQFGALAAALGAKGCGPADLEALSSAALGGISG